jgi:DNA-binding MarR family transcriptional regulator
MENIKEVIFYTLENSIKTYRQFAQKNINEAGLDITIDQWLVMKVIEENSEHKQNEVADKVFKDSASITRIIDLLIKKGFLERDIHSNDRRRTALNLTKKGKVILEKAEKIVSANRKQALKGIDEKKINELRTTLNTIIYNCRK